MFDIVKDSYNAYDDSIKKAKIKEFSAIYIKPNKTNQFFFFEKYNDFWTYETLDGKFDYKINDEDTLENLIEQLKQNVEFEENFTLRVYNYVNETLPDYIKLIIPGHRKLINQEIFGSFELNRLKQVNEKLIENEDEETKKQFATQMDIVSADVSQIVRLISSQAHNDGTLRFTMTLVSQILANIPLSPIDDDEFSANDWIDFNQASEDPEKLKSYLKLDGYEIEEVYLNIRCTKIVKVIYNNIKTNEKETHYYDFNSTVFIDPETNESYWNEKSIESIDLPWSFTPIKEVTLTDKDDKSQFIKFAEMKY